MTQKKKVQASTKGPTKNTEELQNFGVGTAGGVGDFETTKKQDRTRQDKDGERRGGDRTRGEGGNRGRGGDRPRTARGGRGGKEGGRGRGGFTGESSRQDRTDAEGNVIRDKKPRQPREKFEGKDDKFGEKKFDRHQDGTGKARRERKPRAGEETYKKKGEETKEGATTKPAEEEKREPKEPKIQYREEVVGYSLDDVLASRTFGTKKEARAAEGIKAKTQANDRTKEYNVSKIQNQYQKNTIGKVVNANQALLGFGAKHLDRDEDDEEQKPRRNQEGGQRGGRRQNPKQALKKTDDDFPSLA